MLFYICIRIIIQNNITGRDSLPYVDHSERSYEFSKLEML